MVVNDVSTRAFLDALEQTDKKVYDMCIEKLETRKIGSNKKSDKNLQNSVSVPSAVKEPSVTLSSLPSQLMQIQPKQDVPITSTSTATTITITTTTTFIVMDCLICNKASCQHVAIPCGHSVGFCESCLNNHEKVTNLCPFCKKDVDRWIRVLVQ
jgi:hypothetical protein